MSTSLDYFLPEVFCLIMLHQVVNFVQRFADMLPNYEVACEHEHSNCVLIAHKKVIM
jgi:hypothetical protein